MTAGYSDRNGKKGLMDPTARRLIERPLIGFGREVCGDLTAALRREWLVTNGLGGSASGTLIGVNTRRYHGLLVAALTPPVGRIVMVGGLVEWAEYGGRRYPLATHEYADGTIWPDGYRYLESFSLEGTLPIWRFALGDCLLVRRVWMASGQNTTYVSYRIERGTRSVDVQVIPLVTCRDFHLLATGHGWRPAVTPQSRGVLVRMSDDATPFRLLGDGASFSERGDWYWNFRHREETARGLDDRSDLYAPGRFTATLHPGRGVTLVFSAEPDVNLDGQHALRDEQERQESLLACAGVDGSDPVVQQLTLAADQFIVERRMPPGGTGAESGPINPADGRTIIAGYPWFNDWGRDTMIALPGLTLATGRPEDAASILRLFGRHVRDGLIPNNFPDSPGAGPSYNTADAALWYVLAVHAYSAATADGALVDELLPSLRNIVDSYLEGTRFGIVVDPADGLVRIGAPHVQLTWMDVKIGDRVLSPRDGKPVEINALWYNALRVLEGFLRRSDEAAAETYRRAAERALTAFRERFLRAGQDHLVDVADGPDGDDLTLRPNQILALSLPYPLLDGAEAAKVLDSVARALLTTFGLRSLGGDDPGYRGEYSGNADQRDGAYHHGTVWAWLMGPYAEAHFRVHENAAAALALLRPFEHHLHDAGLGSISEIFDGDAPHLPRGCYAQAWSVAEVLRVLRKLRTAPPHPMQQ